ncbi:MAG: ORF6N domain-containing protein [Agriterribacter sp.]
MEFIRSIQNHIYEIRGKRVMLDRNLGILHEVETKVFNQAVKRNIKRFPPDFAFQLTSGEWKTLEPQLDALDNRDSLRSQFVTLKNE